MNMRYHENPIRDLFAHIWPFLAGAVVIALAMFGFVHATGASPQHPYQPIDTNGVQVQAHAPHHYPYIVVEDDVHGRWPVAVAVGRWHGFGLHAGHCTSSRICFRVRDFASGRTGEYATTNANLLNPGGTVLMNSSMRPRNRALRLAIMTHELGHVLGLPHDRRGIMQPYLARGHVYKITRAERSALHRIYGVA